MGARVGVLDADLYGPSQPTMLGVPSQQPKQENGKFIPVRNADGIQVMSIGFLIDPDQAVVWRGPMVSQALQQLLFQSEWDDVGLFCLWTCRLARATFSLRCRKKFL